MLDHVKELFLVIASRSNSELALVLILSFVDIFLIIFFAMYAWSLANSKSAAKIEPIIGSAMLSLCILVNYVTVVYLVFR